MHVFPSILKYFVDELQIHLDAILEGLEKFVIDEQSLILYIPNDAKFTLVLAKEPTLAQRARSCHCGYKATLVR